MGVGFVIHISKKISLFIAKMYGTFAWQTECCRYAGLSVRPPDNVCSTHTTSRYDFNLCTEPARSPYSQLLVISFLLSVRRLLPAAAIHVLWWCACMPAVYLSALRVRQPASQPASHSVCPSVRPSVVYCVHKCLLGRVPRRDSKQFSK